MGTFQISPPFFQPPSNTLRWNLVVPPTVEPVTQDDYAAYQRIKTSDIDPIVVQDKLTSARSRVESYTKRACVSQTYDIFRDLPPGMGSVSYWSWARFFGLLQEVPIVFPKAPFICVNGCFVYDDCDNMFTVPPETYWVSRAVDPARLALRNDFDWPDTGDRSFETFRCQFVTGYLIPFTVAANTENILAPSHGKIVGDMFQLTNRDGNLPAPLQANTNYYVTAVVDANTLQISTTSGGAAITCTNAGTGVQFIGILPSEIRRAILLTAAEDRWGSGAQEKRKMQSMSSRSSSNRTKSGLPEEAEVILEGIRIKRLARL